MLKKVTIIVPVYNVEKFIGQCIESLLAQTYTNLEIILVDDGSTDKSGGLCDDYHHRDARIRVIHKQNGGLSSARNAGIKAATGHYLSFVDSDDYVSCNMIQKLVYSMELNDVDISCCNFSYVYEQGNKSKTHEIAIDADEVYSSKDACNFLLLEDYYLCFACNKLYKKYLFKDIAYPVGKINEDVITTYRVFQKAKKVSFVTGALYFYRMRSDSITHKKFTKRNYDLLEWINIIKSENPDNRYILFGCMLYYLYFIDEMIYSEIFDKLVYQEYARLFDQSYGKLSGYSLKTFRSCQLILLRHAKTVYNLLYVIYRKLQAIVF